MPARPGLTSDATPAVGVRLRGRGLLAVRLGWVIVAALSVGLFAAGIPAEFAALQTPCQHRSAPPASSPPPGCRR
jgi:hypothetical protein